MITKYLLTHSHWWSSFCQNKAWNTNRKLIKRENEILMNDGLSGPAVDRNQWQVLHYFRTVSILYIFSRIFDSLNDKLQSG